MIATRSTARRITTVWHNARDFSLSYALLTLTDSLLRFGRRRGTARALFLRKKHDCIRRVLKRRLSGVIAKHRTEMEKGERPPSATGDLRRTVWVFWWQGEDNAPKIVQACIRSVRRNAAGYEVVLLSKQNLDEYVALPDVIKQKFLAGHISATLLSDIIRVTLLARYGGVWADATIYVTAPLPQALADAPFYTIKPRRRDTYEFVSNFRWCSFFLAAHKHNALMRFAEEFFHEYVKRHDRLIDYYLVDHVFDIAYDEFPQIREMIDRVPSNNPGVSELAAKLDDVFTEEQFRRITRDNYLHKLNRTFEPAAGGRQSFYEFIISDLSTHDDSPTFAE